MSVKNWLKKCFRPTRSNVRTTQTQRGPVQKKEAQPAPTTDAQYANDYYWSSYSWYLEGL